MNNTVNNKKEIKIGLLGYGFMGKVHTHAYRTIQHKYKDIEFSPKLHTIAGIGEEATMNAAVQYSFEKWTNDWREVVDDPDIDVIDVCLPEEMHGEVCVAALEKNKHVFCEKPLALTVEGCIKIMEAAKKNNTKNMCGFNNRFLPAIRLAKEIIESGSLGKLYYIEAKYAQESGHDPEKPADQIRYIYGKAQLGTIRGIGSHLIDIARYLCGDILSLSANVKTMTQERPLTKGGSYRVKTEDIAALNAQFENGAIGTLVASAVATGRKNQLTFEVNGSRGSICFDLDNLNFLLMHIDDGGQSKFNGFTRINVTEKSHPLMNEWWPPSHMLGWESGHVNELFFFLDCIFNDKSVSPQGATFYDGYLAAKIAEAAFESSSLGRKIDVEKDKI